jgi:hypothetical protein
MQNIPTHTMTGMESRALFPTYFSLQGRQKFEEIGHLGLVALHVMLQSDSGHEHGRSCLVSNSQETPEPRSLPRNIVHYMIKDAESTHSAGWYCWRVGLLVQSVGRVRAVAKVPPAWVKLPRQDSQVSKQREAYLC